MLKGNGYINHEQINNEEAEIIVSLTSYPARIKTVHYTINSLLEQTLLPDKIILWLAKKQFKNKEDDLPKELLELKEHGLTIEWCDDLKSHKKYYYAMKNYPNDIIITVDDDLIYKKTLIEDLYIAYTKFPKAVSCTIAREITFDNNGNIKPYVDWVKVFKTEVDEERMDLLAIGCGGILYPPQILSNETFRKKEIIKTCLNADDLWLKTMEIINNVPVFLINSTRSVSKNYIEGTQEEGLFNNNVLDNGNDIALKEILKKYEWNI